MDVTLLKLVVVFAVLKGTVIKAIQLVPSGSVTLFCGMQQQLICTSSLDVTWSKGSTTLKFCSAAGVCPSPTVGHYTFSHNGSSFIMTFKPIKLVDDGQTFSCSDGETGSALMKVKGVPDNTSVISQPSKTDGKLLLTTNCLDAATVNVQWTYLDTNSGTFKDLPYETDDRFIGSGSGSCAAYVGDCIGSTFEKFTIQASFVHDGACKLKVRAILTTSGQFYGPSPGPALIDFDEGACIQGPIPRGTPPCPWYRWVVLTLFLYVVVIAIVSIVVYALAENDQVAPAWVMFVMIITLYVHTVWAVVMIFLLFECTDEPAWSIVLAALSVNATVVSVAVNICAISGCLGKKIAELLRKMHCCAEMDEEERTNLAAVLVVIFWFPWTLGLILLVPLCFKRGRFAEVVQMFWCHNVR